MTRSEIPIRVSAFVLTAVVVWILAPTFLLLFDRDMDRIAVSAFTTLVAGFAANLVSARLFAEGKLSDFGLGWKRSAPIQLMAGIVAGAGAVGLMTGLAVGTGMARFEPQAEGAVWSGPALSVLLGVLLLLGALGEELMFRGHLFQYFVQRNALGTIVATGVLFGIAHLLLNDGINPLAVWNTALWGALFGFAYWRSKALWLPCGLHFGWNLGLVLIGVPLSGLTIKVTGYGLHWSTGPLLSGGEYGPEGGVLASVLGAGLFLLVQRVK